MVWPWLMAFAVLVIVVAAMADDSDGVAAGGIMLAAYVAMRGEVLITAGTAYSYAVSAAIWMAAAVAIQRQNSYRLTAVKALLVLVALCYLVARAISAPREFGSWPFVASDMLAIAAMVCIGWRGFAHISDRILGMARHLYRRSIDPVADSMRVDQEEP